MANFYFEVKDVSDRTARITENYLRVPGLPVPKRYRDMISDRVSVFFPQLNRTENLGVSRVPAGYVRYLGGVSKAFQDAKVKAGALARWSKKGNKFSVVFA